MSSGQQPKGLDLQGENEISTYKGELTPRFVMEQMAKIQNAFPALPSGFYEAMSARLKEAGFCNERLSDAVNHVIDTCIYPQPTIAQFISFDKKVKLYSYQDMLKMADDGLWSESFQAVKLDGRTFPVWAHIDDIKKFNLQIFKK